MTYTVEIYRHCFLPISRTITNHQRYALTDKYLITLFEEYRAVLINTVYSHDITTS